MKSMILVMAFLMALTVFASFASSVEEDRMRMARKAELANTYGQGQPEGRTERFVAREFVPQSPLHAREEDMAKVLTLGVVGK